MLLVTAGVAAYSIKKIRNDMDDKKIPLMGVMGAFIFAAQMINFSIPATGSSGHLGGGLLLSVLLGPYAGFLTMASILAIQALFFADGGLLALGCNIFNLGFFPCFIAYPLIYKVITRNGYSSSRMFGAAVLASVIGLQLGAFGVVLETLFSGNSELPFSTFVLLMQPIHLAIGIVEGLVTAVVVGFVWKARPEIIENAFLGEALGGVSMKQVLSGLAVTALFTGAVLSWFASSHPDGLEWAMFKTAGAEELEVNEGVHEALGDVQQKVAIMPDYNFRASGSGEEPSFAQDEETAWPAVSTGTSVSGVVGGLMTLVLAGIIGIIISIAKRRGNAGTA